MSWFRKIFPADEAYVGSFVVKQSGETIYCHCFEDVKSNRRIELINADRSPYSKWDDTFKRSRLYQLRIQPWCYWGKKDSGIFTYEQVKNPKEEFLAALKGEATWIINNDNSG